MWHLHVERCPPHMSELSATCVCVCVFTTLPASGTRIPTRAAGASKDAYECGGHQSMRMYIQICRGTSACICVCMYVYAYVSVYVYVCMYICMQLKVVDVHSHTHTHRHRHRHTHTHTHTHTYRHTHTHTHTHPRHMSTLVATHLDIHIHMATHLDIHIHMATHLEMEQPFLLHKHFPTVISELHLVRPCTRDRIMHVICMTGRS